jgi:hypothetical protein
MLNDHCHRVSTQLQLINIIIIINKTWRTQITTSSFLIENFSCGAWTRFGVMGILYGDSLSHSMDTPQRVGLFWTSDQPLPDNTQQSQQTDIHALGEI